MINGNRKTKEFFTAEELKLLYKLDISKEDTLEKAFNELTDYLTGKGYHTLSEAPNNEIDKKYIEILKKLWDILPVY